MAETNRRSQARVASWVAAALFLASALGALGLAVAVSAGWQRAELTHNVESLARDALGIDVSIDALEGPLYPRFSVRGLRVGAAEDLLAAVELATVEWSFAPGWPISVEIHQVNLRGPTFSLRRSEDGVWNLPPASEEESEPLSLWIDSLVWSDADVTVDATTAEPPWSLAAGSEGSLTNVGLPWSRDRALSGELQIDFRPAGSDSIVTGGGLRVGRVVGEPISIEGTVEGPVGSVSVVGSGGWRSPVEDQPEVDTRVRIEFAELDASQLPGGTPVATRLNGTADLAATGALLASGVPEHLTFAVDLEPSLIGAAEVDLASLRGEIDDRWWKLTEGRAQGRGIEFEASGSGQGDRLTALGVDLRLDSLETVLRGWSDDASVSGRMTASAQLAGPVGRPSGGLNLHARDLIVQGISLGELVGRMRVVGGTRAEIDELRLSGGAVELRAAPGGAMERDDNGVAVSGLALEGSGQSLRIDGWVGAEEMRGVAIQISHADVTTWARLFSLESQPRGTVTGMLRADGPLNDPTAHAEFEWAGASWDDSALGVLTGNATARQGRLEVEASLRAGEIESLDLTGAAAIPSVVGDTDAWMRRSSDLLEVKAAGVDLARVAPFLPEDVRDPRGSVDLALEVHGGRDRRVAGWIQFAGGWLDVVAIDQSVGPVQGRISVDDTTLRIERLSVGEAGAQAVLDGSVTLNEEIEPTALDIGLKLDAFPLQRVPLPRSGDEEPAEIVTGGRADADFRLTGSVAAPRLTGGLKWVNPSWNSVVLERISAEVDASLESVEAKAQLFYASSEIASVHATLPVPDEPETAMDWLLHGDALVEIRGDDLEFALLEPFLPRLVRRPRGHADIELRIEGASPEPNIDGTVVVRNGAVDVPMLRQTYSPIEGRARFDDRVVTIEAIDIGSADAGARITGELQLVDLLPASADLAMALSGFPLARSPLVHADVDGSLEIAGSLEAPNFTGDLVLENTRVKVRDDADPALKEVRIAAESGPGSVRETVPERGGTTDRAEVDVSIRIPRGTWIRTGIMELDVEGRGRLTKRPFGTPRVAGTMNVVRGTVRLELRRFIVRKGTATLTGGREVDPLLDVEAIYPVADVVVVAHLTGRASAPALRLESEPPLPQDDVVAYLIFGRPSSQLGASEQGSVNAAAAGLAAGLALAELREIMGDQFPVDTIDLSIGEGSEPSRLEVGRYVGRNLFVRIGQAFGPESQQEVGLSYRLNENWSVESTTGTDATAGADVFWSIDY